MRKTLFLIALVLSPLLATPQSAYACSCMYYEDEEERHSAYYSNADLIIQGVPFEVGFEKDGLKHYAVSVEKVWKGTADAMMDIATALDSAGCGIQLALDEHSIIFAYEIEGTYHTGLCSGTEPASDELSEWLHAYDKEPMPQIDGSPGFDCTPYVCKNGDIFPRCDGSAEINYLIAPCAHSDGEGLPEPPKNFGDVPEGHSNYKAISFVKQEGIVNGYEGNVYIPDQQINRAEFTKIIVAANYARDAIDSCELNELFSDVSQSNWFADYVCMAKNDGIVDGYPDSTFRPAAFVNFAEAAKIVVGAFGIDTKPEDHLGVWWRPYVFALARIGGLPTTFSDPNQEITRGDMAEIIYRVMMGMGYEMEN